VLDYVFLKMEEEANKTHKGHGKILKVSFLEIYNDNVLDLLDFDDIAPKLTQFSD